MIVRTARQYRQQHVSKHWLILMSCMWALIILVALFPASTDAIANILGIGRGADVLVYTAIVLLLAATARMRASIEEQRKEITELTRKIAIDEAEYGSK